MKGSSVWFWPTEEMAVTGSMPRPVRAMSVGFEVVASDPLVSTSQIALVRTPPAVNQRPPPAVLGEEPSLTVIEAKSTSERLYPKVWEFAMLSEIVASLLACAFSPETPAVIEEEIPILSPLSARGRSLENQLHAASLGGRA